MGPKLLIISVQAVLIFSLPKLLVRLLLVPEQSKVQCRQATPLGSREKYERAPSQEGVENSSCFLGRTMVVVFIEQSNLWLRIFLNSKILFAVSHCFSP